MRHSKPTPTSWSLRTQASSRPLIGRRSGAIASSSNAARSRHVRARDRPGRVRDLGAHRRQVAPAGIRRGGGRPPCGNQRTSHMLFLVPHLVGPDCSARKSWTVRSIHARCRTWPTFCGKAGGEESGLPAPHEGVLRPWARARRTPAEMVRSTWAQVGSPDLAGRMLDGSPDAILTCDADAETPAGVAIDDQHGSCHRAPANALNRKRGTQDDGQSNDRSERGTTARIGDRLGTAHDDVGGI